MTNIQQITILVLFFASVQSFSGIGDRIWRTFLVFDPLPLNVDDAENNDWYTSNSSCDNNLGIRYQQDGLPIVLYFTLGGQVSGLGIIRNDKPVSTLIPDFWKPLNDTGHYEITLSFRNANSGILCSGNTAQEVIGDSLWINQDSIAMPIGLTKDQASELEWTEGHCITKMGTHWAYDTNTHPYISHTIATLVPIFPMYNDNTGLLSAFLVHSNYVEKVEPFGIWEGPFIPYLFCKNLCPPCTFDTNFFSTIHFMLTDPSMNICGDSCTNSTFAIDS